MSTSELDLLTQQAMQKAKQQQSAGPRGGGAAPTRPSAEPRPGGPRGGGGDAVQKQRPAPPAPVDAEPGPIGRAVLDVTQGISELPQAAARGVLGAGKAVADIGGDFETWVNENVVSLPYLDLGGEGDWIKWHRNTREVTEQRFQAVAPAPPKSTTGQQLESLTKFAVGMAVAGHAMRAAGVTGAISSALGAGKLATAVEGGVAGAITDLALGSLEKNETNLFNLISDHSELARPLADYLALKDDDGSIERRLKNMAEGTIFGAALDTFIGAASWVKNSRLLKNASTEAERKIIISQLEKDLDALINAQEKAEWKVRQNPETGEFDVVGKPPATTPTPSGATAAGPHLPSSEWEDLDKIYSQRQKAIDEFEDQIDAKYGKGTSVAEPAYPAKTEQEAKLRRPSKLSPEDQQKLFQLYAERDLVSNEQRDRIISNVQSKISGMFGGDDAAANEFAKELLGVDRNTGDVWSGFWKQNTSNNEKAKILTSSLNTLAAKINNLRGSESAFANFKVRLEDGGFRIVAERPQGYEMFPQEVLDDIQKYADALFPDMGVKVPGARTQPRIGSEAVDGTVRDPLGPREARPVAPEASVPPAEVIHPISFKSESEAAAEAATLNMRAAQFAGRTTDFAKLTPENIEDARRVWKVLNDNPGSDLATERFAFNLATDPGPEDTTRLLNALYIVMKEEYDKAMGQKVLTNAELRDRMKAMFPNFDTDVMMANLGSLYNDTRDMAARFTAGRAFLNTTGRRVSQLSQMLDGDPGNAMVAKELAAMMDLHYRAGLWTKGISTEVARTLQAHNRKNLAAAADIVATGAVKDVAPQEASKQTTREAAQEAVGKEGLLSMKLKAALPLMSTEQLATLARRVRLASGDASALHETLDVIAKHDFGKSKSQVMQGADNLFAALNQLQVGMMLSGIPTTISNIVGTATAVTVSPITSYVKGSLMSGFSKLGTKESGQIARQEAVDLFTGMFTEFKESARAGWNALKTGTSALDSPFTTLEYSGPIQGYLGAAINAPGRILMAQDDFFKSMSYRSHVRAQALKEGRAMGLGGDRLGKYVDDALQAAYSESRGATNQAAMKYARQNTFTDPLKKWKEADSVVEGMGYYVSKMSTEVPAFRYFAAPFVRTPTRLYEFTYSYTPLLQGLERVTKEKLRNGGEEAAEVWAKWAVGSTVWGLGIGLAWTGNIVGAAPKDPAMKANFLSLHPEYSLKIPGTDTWVKYNRMDPLLTPFGIIADLSQIWTEHPNDHNSMPAAVTASISSAVGSKTYLFALAEFMETAFNGTGSEHDTFWKRKITGTLTPSIGAQLNTDPYLRETRGIVDSLMSRTQGFSELLPSRKNYFGEPFMKIEGAFNRAVNPFTVYKSDPKNRKMDEELLDLGKGFAPPDRFIPGTRVDLQSKDYGMRGVQTPYDRMMDLLANPVPEMKVPGNKPLREAFREVMEGPQWDKLGEGTIEYPGGQQFDALNSILQGYRKAALGQVYREFPALLDAARTGLMEKAKAKTAKKDKTQGSPLFKSFSNLTGGGSK